MKNDITADVEEGIDTAAITTVDNGEGGDDMPAQPIQNELNDSLPTYHSNNGDNSDEDYPGTDDPAMDVHPEEIPIDETTDGIEAFVVPTVYDGSDVK
eukprot:6528364-Ditylum_brightwellii.AAC.1